jgi:L-amino acid N-acyltransferase YncA
MHIRPATDADLPAILAIYNHAIEHTTATWDYAPHTLAMRQAWLTTKEAAGLPVIVAEDAEGVVGFGTYGPFRPQEGYCFTVEHSIYVAEDKWGRGIGKRLLTALIESATAQGMHVMIAGIDADNAVSIHLHRTCGFVEVAHFKEVGRKFDRWLDVIFMQKLLPP